MPIVLAACTASSGAFEQTLRIPLRLTRARRVVEGLYDFPLVFLILVFSTPCFRSFSPFGAFDPLSLSRKLFEEVRAAEVRSAVNRLSFLPLGV